MAPVKLGILTILTMVAFAANSVFCRLALVDPANDALSFTAVRLVSGAAVLIIFLVRQSAPGDFSFSARSFLAPVMLFAYALFFSLSYVQIDAGTGALILFACVQLTMMIVAFARGQRLTASEWLGFALAAGGLVYLLLPGAGMPSVSAAALMAIAGVSWGAYTILGQGSGRPVFMTARNFVYTVPLCGVLFLAFEFELTAKGWTWAILSGGLTSGLGYVLWYHVLKDLVTSTAAIVQLSVPAIAAIGGVLFLGESIGMRLVIASALIFGGIVLKVRSA